MADGNVLAADDHAMKRVRFGRSRFLAAAGGTVFGATYFRRAGRAWALCGSANPCGPSEKCCCCSGTNCCQAGCYRRTGCGPPNFNPWCWNVCAGSRITCCDWYTGNNLPCTCRENTGNC